MASQSSLPTTLRTPPSVSSYTPLADHETRTPASFFEGPPVLYYHKAQARAYLSKENQDRLPWGSSGAAVTPDEAWPVMADDSVGQNVDIFVGSDTLTIYCPSADCGIALPYPVIGLHAIKSAFTADSRRVPTIYMQLELAGASAGDSEPETVELTLIPAGASADAPDGQSASEASKLFDAISACADLHPDRFDGDDDDDDADYPSFFRANGANGDNGGDDDDDDDDDGYYAEGDAENDGMDPIDGFQGVFRSSANGGASLSDLPPPMPGSGGWITADNMHQFFDEDGNWLGRGGSLGEGAGRVRGRDESEAEAANEAPVDAHGTEDAASASGAVTNGDSKRTRIE